MTTQLYLQKAEMQLARGMEEKALESLLAALACQDRDAVSETQVRCLLGEYWFVHQQYVQAEEQLSWISDHAERLEQDYDDLLNEEIREAEVLLGIMQRYAPWPEDNEKPYYTDKPDWDAFGAMLLVAACHTYNEPAPSTVEKDWNFGEHPLVARLASDEERVWSLFRGATWWLPLTDAFFFQAPLPTDNTAAISTVGGLRKELEKLNQLAWQADEDTILDWADTEGYPVDGTVGPDGQYSKADILEHTQFDTQSLAKFAFSMFWQAMRFAEEQQVPILLDY